MADERMLRHTPAAGVVHESRVSLARFARRIWQLLESVLRELQHVSVEGRDQQIAVGTFDHRAGIVSRPSVGRAECPPSVVGQHRHAFQSADPQSAGLVQVKIDNSLARQLGRIGIIVNRKVNAIESH
jgi:hypothetical protein